MDLRPIFQMLRIWIPNGFDVYFIFFCFCFRQVISIDENLLFPYDLLLIQISYHFPLSPFLSFGLLRAFLSIFEPDINLNRLTLANENSAVENKLYSMFGMQLICLKLHLNFYAHVSSPVASVAGDTLNCSQCKRQLECPVY